MKNLQEWFPSVQKSWELAKQESKSPAIGEEEKQFIAALQERKVKDAPLEQLKEVLRLVMVKIGLRAANWPSEEEKAVLLSHILTNYGGHTPKEILLAFDMAILGQLDVEVNHFENFSCKYFSEIMNAYRAWAKEAHRQTVKEPLPAIEHKEDLSDQTMRDWYNDTAKQVKENKLPLELIPIMLADWLIEKGELEIEAYHPHAARWIGTNLFANATDRDTRRQYNEFKAMYNSGEFSGHWIEKIAAMSKRMAVNDKILKEPK